MVHKIHVRVNNNKFKAILAKQKYFMSDMYIKRFVGLGVIVVSAYNEIANGKATSSPGRGYKH